MSGQHRVGEVARITGLTVRALRYYEEIGLLAASGRSEGGHRLYSAGDLERLYRVQLLRRLDLPLAEIAKALDDPAWDMRGALERHIRELDGRIEATQRLRVEVGSLLRSVRAGGALDTDALLNVLEGMTMLEATIQRRIGIVVYDDLAAACQYLVDVFGLGPCHITRDEEGNAVHAEVQAGDGVLWLHPESPRFGLRSARSLGAATGSIAVMVDDVDAHYRHARDHGADIVYEPVDQPYGYREYSARDPEGQLWSFMRAIG